MKNEHIIPGKLYQLREGVRSSAQCFCARQISCDQYICENNNPIGYMSVSDIVMAIPGHHSYGAAWSIVLFKETVCFVQRIHLMELSNVG